MLQAKFICSVKRPKRSQSHRKAFRHPRCSHSEELPAAIAALKTEMEKEKEYLKAVREREDKLFKEGKDLDEEKKPRSNSLFISLSELIRCWKCLN